MMPSGLTDTELISEVARLARCEREATATLVAHLVELHARRLHLVAGCGSLFTYCTRVLRLSESEAYDRMKAAKVARRYPPVLGLLAERRVSLTTIRLLAPYLTRENQASLLTEACGKGKREVQELIARRFPKPDVPSSIRTLPAAYPLAAPVPTSPVAALPPPPPSASLPPRPLITPLAPARYQVTFTADAETRELLELARDLLRHAVPSGDPAQIFARSLKSLVEELVRLRYGATSEPYASRGQARDSRHVPADVKRQVFLRDRGRCAYLAPGGERCGDRAFVEFHHVRPYAAGGGATVDNIELRCRAHNGLEAHLFFGASRIGETWTPYVCVTDDTFSFRNENTYDRSRCDVDCCPSSSASP